MKGSLVGIPQARDFVAVVVYHDRHYTMNGKPSIRQIDGRRGAWRTELAELRARLSPAGDIVSEAGKRKTIEVFGEPLAPAAVVERICRDVQQLGLAAVLKYSAKLDHAELDGRSLRVPQAELDRAYAAADPNFLATLDRIRENVLRFQRALLPEDVQLPLAGGGYLRQRYLPLDRVGICVPGGAAAYPSTVLMTAVPAMAAGVEQIALVAPPTRFGAYNDDLLATCQALGVREVYRMGGAQAVAALAYGVEGVPRVDKIVGPGNLFVALAKKFVYGQVDIDSIAGPSEVVVIADDSTPPRSAAADLIAQAEHAPGSSMLVSWSQKLLDAAAHELDVQLKQLERGDLARQSLAEFGALVLVADEAEAAEVANEVAPEHLHIATDRAEALLARCRHAGAVFLGPFTPVAVGDYVAGPSHVLPTGGTARFASGLASTDFLRRTSVIHYSQSDLRAAADDLRLMATKEGLTAHRASADVRL